MRARLEKSFRGVGLSGEYRPGPPWRLLLLLVIVCGGSAAHAQEHPLSGKYAYVSSQRPGEVAWVLQASDGVYSIVQPRTGESISGAHSWTARERAVFWQSMLWPIEVSKEVVCVGGVTKVICRIGPEQRQKVPPLQELGSDYFYADDFGSIWPLKKLPDSR